MSVCLGCGKDLELQNSHVIPEFFYKYVYTGDHKFIRVSEDAERDKKPEQKGYREKLLCHDCEEELSKLERVTASFFDELTTGINQNIKVNEIHPGITLVENYNYSIIKKCLLSILWRSSIAKQDFFSNYSLGPYNEKIRKLIFSKDSISWNVFPIHVSKVKLGAGFDPGLILCHEKGSYEYKTMYSITLAGFCFDYYIVENMANEEYKPYFMNEDACAITEVAVESITRQSIINRFKDADVKSFFERHKK